jgi:hypothetical protein
VRNRVGLPNRRSARNRTYPGRTSPPDSGRADRKRAKARLCGGRRPCSRSKPPKADQDRRSRTDERLACEAPGRPIVDGKDVEGRGGHPPGWQPCSEAERPKTLRRFRVRTTSHQPMSSERAGKSVRADRKRVARLAVWRVDGRKEPAERSIVKTLVLARVARSVVAGDGFGRERGRGSPNGRSVSNGRPVAKREPEMLP